MCRWREVGLKRKGQKLENKTNPKDEIIVYLICLHRLRLCENLKVASLGDFHERNCLLGRLDQFIYQIRI